MEIGGMQMRIHGHLGLYVLLAIFVLALVASATPASASKLTTWLLGGASAYSFSRDNNTAGVLFGLGAVYTWQQDRTASRQQAQPYYVSPQQYTYYQYPQPQYQQPVQGCDYFSRYCQ